MELKGSRTEANLMAAFAGETQARSKYNVYEAQAKKEGYQQISNIFKETADNERAHALMWFQYLHGNLVPPTLANLEDAAGGEHFEWSEMYEQFAKEAQEEGFTEIAAKMKLVASVEKAHEDRFRKLIFHLNNNEVFKRSSQQQWICLNCGYIHCGDKAPEQCPACSYPQMYFQIKPENL